MSHADLQVLPGPAALGVNAWAAQVYLQNDSGPIGVVDVEVDGRLVFGDVFVSAATMFPRELGAGEHRVVVTPASLTPGQGDVLDTTVSIPGEGTSTLTLAETEDSLSLPVLGVEVPGTARAE